MSDHPLVFCDNCAYKKDASFDSYTHNICTLTPVIVNTPMGQHTEYTECEKANPKNQCDGYYPSRFHRIALWIMKHVRRLQNI